MSVQYTHAVPSDSLTLSFRAHTGRNGQGRPSQGEPSTILFYLINLTCDSQEILKVAFENGINMFDTAEGYESGKSEEEMYVASSSKCKHMNIGANGF